jgi:hypothetical protein
MSPTTFRAAPGRRCRSIVSMGTSTVSSDSATITGTGSRHGRESAELGWGKVEVRSGELIEFSLMKSA